MNVTVCPVVYEVALSATARSRSSRMFVSIPERSIHPSRNRVSGERFIKPFTVPGSVRRPNRVRRSPRRDVRSRPTGWTE
jgi:hypothetical protein